MQWSMVLMLQWIEILMCPIILDHFDGKLQWNLKNVRVVQDWDLDSMEQFVEFFVFSYHE